MSSSIIRKHEGDELHAEPSKRPKLEGTADDTEKEHILPPSHALLGIPLPVASEGSAMNFLEANVGISEYVGCGNCKVQGVIKQRFTDFLVYEVDLDSKVLHLNNIAKPDSSKKKATSEQATSLPDEDIIMEEPEKLQPEVMEDETQSKKNEADTKAVANSVEGAHTSNEAGGSEENTKNIAKSNDLAWTEHTTATLASFFTDDAISQVKKMFLEGPEPPRVSDNGWGSRAAHTPGNEGLEQQAKDETEAEKQVEVSTGGGKRGRGGRRGRGGGKQDNRKVISEPISSKEVRTSLHKAIRNLFNGRLDSETDLTPCDEGSRVVIRWAKQGGGRGGRAGGRTSGNTSRQDEHPPRGTYPPYIHFTLQKTNRDTQDALGHLSRLLHVNIRDLSVAGTKDKRGVTVQRVSLKRNNKTVEEVWKLANNLSARRTLRDVLEQRGERGIRIADLNYRKASLELGMLKGNAFVITLRNVEVDSLESMDELLNSMKHKGFINYYGMQRFGTASVPTHAIGLALLQSNWQKAVSLILQKRHGEHPDVVAAREAWLEDGDLDRALELLPRRVVAERCILESFKKQGGETRNAMGALSTIPRNLRLMYVHAYQSYVWNAIVSERIRKYGAEKPVIGDLVFEAKAEMTEQADVDDLENGDPPLLNKDDYLEETKGDAVQPGKKSKKPYVAPKVKTLTEEDLNKYTIFDVIMPLPGTDVAYPGGELGERYREFLRMDGLDPDNFVRKQRDYTLNGSYRAILHLPKEMTWTALRYTDPDVPLAQSDEDKLLGFDPPSIVEDGKFMALQINLTLGTAAYATMALREITKTETSSHFQTNLTIHSKDQKYRGTEVGLGE